MSLTLLTIHVLLSLNQTRLLSQVNDQVVIAVDGEYADFQEIQTICQDLVLEHDQIEPYGFWKVPLPPSPRTNWTRLVLPPVLSGHVSRFWRGEAVVRGLVVLGHDQIEP